MAEAGGRWLGSSGKASEGPLIEQRGPQGLRQENLMNNDVLENIYGTIFTVSLSHIS